MGSSLSSTTAAASTATAYRAHYSYGSANDDNDIVLDLLNDNLGSDLMPPNEDADSDPTVTNIDDEDYVDLDSESEDKAHFSFPVNKNLSMNITPGGPQPTNTTTGMIASEAKFAK